MSTRTARAPCWTCDATAERPARVAYDAAEVVTRLAGRWTGEVESVAPLPAFALTVVVSPDAAAAPTYGLLNAPADCVVRAEDVGRCDGADVESAVAVHADSLAFGDETATLRMLGAAMSCPVASLEGCPFVEIERSVDGKGYTLELAFDDTDGLWGRIVGPDAPAFKRIGGKVE